VLLFIAAGLPCERCLTRWRPLARTLHRPAFHSPDRRVGPKPAIGIVAALFAAGTSRRSSPEGAPLSETLSLAGDTVLGVIVLSTVRHSRDILWFWPVHAVLDLSQFTSIPGI